MKDSFLFLGTGSSWGVPVVGCHCSVCESTFFCNKRLRPAGLFTIKGLKILLDVGPDYRSQAIQHHIHSLDGVIITHAHHDHTAGIDDLRVYYARNKPLPLLLSKETYEDLKVRFAYIFQPKEPSKTLVSRFEVRLLEKNEGSVLFEGIQFHYLTFHQGNMGVNGFRYQNFAYLSDIKEYSSNIFDHLKGVETLVISALRFTPSTLHFTVDEAVEFVNKVGAKKAWFTHISHELDHERTNAYLPPYIRLAYDGLEIPIGPM